MCEKLSYDVLGLGARAFGEGDSQQKRLEEALRESESKYGMLVENIPLKVFYKNRDSVYVSVNENYARDFGIKAEGFLGKTDYDFFPRELADKYRADDERIMVEGKSEEIEESYVKNGHQVWVRKMKTPVRDDRDRTIGLLGAFWDITARKQAEEALCESEQKFRVLAESTPTAVLLYQDDRYLYANPAAETVFGYSREEILGMKTWEIFHPDYHSLVKERTRNQQRGESAINRYDLKILTKDGFEKWIELVSSTTLIEGKHSGIVSVIDVTERKRSEIEREMLREQLILSQKREAIGVLAGGIAHDFNNILAGIVGYVEIARTGLPVESRNAEYLTRALKACDRAKKLVRQILALGRQTEHESMPLRPEPIVKEALRMLRSSIPASIEINQNVRPGLPVVVADPTQIHQIVMNLCMNAAQAIEDDQGTIEVSLDEVSLDMQAAARSGGLFPGDYVRLRVRDTGCGIPSHVLKNIFDPYFTTKRAGDGTGLGLSVVYGIVKGYGGDISVESQEGRGAVFTVLLPAAERNGDHGPEAVASRPSLPVGREHVLFVDDEAAVIDIGRDYLEMLGYRVTTRASSLEALQLFRADPLRFDLVVTDTAMPQMTGDRLAVELLSIRPDIPIILCTGFSRRVTERRAKEIGIKAFLMKPITQYEMANTVRTVLDAAEKKTKMGLSFYSVGTQVQEAM